MLTKTTFLLSALALSAQIAVADLTQPACFTAAVNTQSQSDQSDVHAMCTGSNADTIVDYICKHCGDQTKAALGALEDGCLGSGMDISTDNACKMKSMSSAAMHTSTHTGHKGGAHHTATSTTTATASASKSAGSAEGSNAAVGVDAANGGITAALLFAALVAL